jgi:hypothetical protein
MSSPNHAEPLPSADKETASAIISSTDDDLGTPRQLPLSKRILGVIWDSLDKSPEERAFIAKADWWILSYCCIAYFVKYLDQTNVSLSRRQLPGVKLSLTRHPRSPTRTSRE